MNVEVTKLPESRVELRIELTPAEGEEALQRTYKQLVQRLNIPGFRKGKAPRLMVERALGREVFLHEATEEAVRWGYRKAVDQEHLTPIDEASVDTGEEHQHLEPDQPFAFTATVTVEPEVQLPSLDTIHVERTEPEVTEADVEALLDDIRQRNATLEPVRRPAQLGDVLTMNISGKVEGEQVLNQENADFELTNEEEAGPHPQLPGLAAQLVGAQPGDIREIVLSLPESIADPELAGKTIFLTLLVKEVKRKVLPERDDELAQSVSQFGTLAELQEALRENLMLERRFEAERKLAADVVEAVSNRTFVEIPPVLIEQEVESLLRELRRGLEARGISWDLYQQVSSQGELDLRAEMQEEALNNVKSRLILNAVADQEGIEVSNREVDQDVEELIRGLQATGQERRQLRNSSALRADLRGRERRQRAMQRLVELATGEVAAEPSEQPEVEGATESVPIKIG